MILKVKVEIVNNIYKAPKALKALKALKDYRGYREKMGVVDHRGLLDHPDREVLKDALALEVLLVLLVRPVHVVHVVLLVLLVLKVQ